MSLDALRFRDGETLSLSDESGGSSQHFLLLDEFYRSGLLLAGLPPLWWAVPAKHEHRYDDYVSDAITSGEISEGSFVDFGGIANVPANEFFGVAVWHLYKSIDSPYKSVLKLLLIEIYASQYPDGDLLSLSYKKKIAEKTANLNELDPYIAMYRKVEKYLIEQNDHARLEFMRRSFYIKTNVHLSTSNDTRLPDWQRHSLTKLTKSWHWSDATIRHLDVRGAWKVSSATQERRVITKSLQQSYAVLSKFARVHGHNQKITGADLNTLGRKLYAVFQRKPSKVEVVTRGICPNPQEPVLSLQHLTRQSGDAGWCIYAGTVTEQKATAQKPLITATAPVKILTWCYFNRVAGKSTTWQVVDPAHNIDVTEVKKSVSAIRESFPIPSSATSASAALNRAARPEEILLISNLGVRPMTGKTGDGSILTTNRTDPLQFGGKQINLIQSVDLLVSNSWGELFVHHFDGNTALVDAMMEYLQLAPNDALLPEMKICCAAKDYSNSIESRIRDYATDLAGFLKAPGHECATQFITQFDKGFCRAFLQLGKPNYEYHQSHTALVKALQQPNSEFKAVVFDPRCRNVGILNRIYEKNKADIIQLFVHEDGLVANIYALDERGTLFTNRQPFHRVGIIFEQYARFLRNVQNNCLEPKTAVSDNISNSAFEFYLFKPTPNDPYGIIKITTSLDNKKDYLPISVFIDVDSDRNRQITMFCEDVEFSSVEYSGRLFLAMAEHIYDHRRKFETYPIYITELDLSNRYSSINQMESHQTIHLLNYKKRIEFQLTQALQANVPN